MKSPRDDLQTVDRLSKMHPLAGTASEPMRTRKGQPLVIRRIFAPDPARAAAALARLLAGRPEPRVQGDAVGG